MRMRSGGVSLYLFLFLLLVPGACLKAQQQATGKPWPIRAVIVTTFEIGADTGDIPGEFQLWVEREHLTETVDFPGGVHPLRTNPEHTILGMVSGTTLVNASASMMALGLDPRFDLTHAYVLINGIAGVDPQVASIGSAAWASFVINDVGRSIDEKEAPKDWPYGIFPIGSIAPNPPTIRPAAWFSSNNYPLNPKLAAWAFAQTRDLKLGDDAGAAAFRAEFKDFPNALKPPFVLMGDSFASDLFWHGAVMTRYARDWVKLYTAGKGTFAMTNMEDSGFMNAIVRLNAMHRVDADRVMVLRTGSNFSQQKPGQTAIESVTSSHMFGTKLAVESAWLCGSTVLHKILAQWDLTYAKPAGRLNPPRARREFLCDSKGMEYGSEAAPEHADQQEPYAGLADLKHRSARGAAITMVSQVLRFLVTFGTQLWLAHLLIPAQFGVVAMAAPVVGFISLFTDLGLSQATIQRKQISQGELSSLFWINVAASLLFAAVMLLVSPLAALMYHEPRVGPIVRALALIMPLSGLVAQVLAIMSRRMQFFALSVVDIMAVVAGAVAAIVAARLGAGYWSLVIQQAAISLTTLCVAWPLSRWRPQRPAIGPEIRSLLRFGGHMTAFSIVNFFSMYFDNVLIGILNGAFALGLFERAFRLVISPLTQVAGPISRIALPMLARLQDDRISYRQAYLRMLQTLVLLTGPGLMCSCVLSSDVTMALLGRNWMGAAPMLHWLSLAAFASTFTVASCWLLVSQDRVAEQTKCGFISSGLIMVALLAGMHWGAVGICISYALFAPFVHGTFVWISTKTGAVRLRHVGLASYPILVAIAVSAISSGLLFAHVGGKPILRVFAGLALNYLLTGLLLLFFPSGKLVLQDMWRLRLVFRPRAAGATP